MMLLLSLSIIMYVQILTKIIWYNYNNKNSKVSNKTAHDGQWRIVKIVLKIMISTILPSKQNHLKLFSINNLK